ncbi:hypothetical protein N9S30_00020 [bacterium]|nr:hypothetical protein [bacterium]
MQKRVVMAVPVEAPPVAPPPPPPPQSPLIGPDAIAVECIDEGIPPETAPPLLLAGRELAVHRSFSRRTTDGRIEWQEGAVLNGFSTVQTCAGPLQCALVLEPGVATLLVQVCAFEKLFGELDTGISGVYPPNTEHAQLARLAAMEAKNAVFNTPEAIVAHDDEAHIVINGPVPFARLIDDDTSVDFDWFAGQLEGVDVSRPVGIGRFFGSDQRIAFRTILQRSPATGDGEHLKQFPFVNLDVLRPLVVASRRVDQIVPKPKVIKTDAREGPREGWTLFDFVVETSPKSTEFQFASSARELLLTRAWERELTSGFFTLDYIRTNVYVLDVFADRVEFEGKRVGWHEARRLLNMHAAVLAYDIPSRRWMRATRSGECRASETRLSDSAISLLMSAREPEEPRLECHAPLKRLRDALEASGDGD